MNDEELYKAMIALLRMLISRDEMNHALLCVHIGAYEHCEHADECLTLAVAKVIYDEYFTDEDKAEADRILYGDSSRLN